VSTVDAAPVEPGRCRRAGRTPRRRNALLTARIAELGYDHQELADRLNVAILESTGRPGQYSDRHIRMLVEGAIGWPWPRTRAALEQVLDRPILQLGFVPYARGYRRPPRRTAPRAARTPAARRQVVAAVDGQQLTIDLPAVPDGQVSYDDVARSAAPLAQVYDLHGRFGPARLATVVAGRAVQLARASEGMAMSQRVRRGVYALVGQWWATAAWLAAEAGDTTAAQRHLRQATWEAVPGADWLLDAHIGYVMSVLAAHGGDYPHALALLRPLTRCQGRPNRHRVKAVAYLQHALVVAHLGQLAKAENALDQAAEALEAAGPGSPPWLTRAGVWTVDAHRARAAWTVGRYDLAQKYGQHAIEVTPEGQVWDRTCALLDLAAACLGSRDVEQATEHAHTVLELAGRLTDGIRTPVLAARLDQLAATFAAWTEVPEAQTWLDRYGHAAAGHPPASR
jgi:tetratricopeptide (TPR) repeat protein